MKKFVIGLIVVLIGILIFSCSSSDDDSTFNKEPATVVIGTQTWMLENLNVSTYRNGDAIPQVTDDMAWSALTTGAWCYYDNDPANEAIYGKLYNWYAVNDPRGLAPTGYHVPSDAEWNTLITFLGGVSDAGGKMKSTTLWNSPNVAASNSSGFTGLPGGYCYSDGTFGGLYINGIWWSSSDSSPMWTGSRGLYYGESYVSDGIDSKTFGFSVRCLRD